VTDNTIFVSLDLTGLFLAKFFAQQLASPILSIGKGASRKQESELHPAPCL
jgi:hypothetical protein